MSRIFFLSFVSKVSRKRKIEILEIGRGFSRINAELVAFHFFRVHFCFAASKFDTPRERALSTQTKLAKNFRRA